MTGIELIAILVIATIPLVAVGRFLNIPYPIVLVVGGLLLSFVPHMPEPHLDPKFVFLVLLPPLLYWSAVTAPSDEMRANARWIGPLTIGLVIATTAAVGATLHWAVPAISWGIALIFGAIVAPTDEVAVIPIVERLHVPRHIVAIIQGESLLNDAIALVLYALAIGAVVTGSFSIGGSAVKLAVVAIGSVLAGLAVGRLGVLGWKWIRDSQLQGVISVVLPYVAYLPADRFGLSGVLAAVTAGLYVNRFTPLVIKPRARLRVSGYWSTMVFLINALLFLAAGVAMHSIVLSVSRYPRASVIAATIAVNVVVIGVRFAWVFAQSSIPWLADTSSHSGAHWKHSVITAWSGLRGSISLAAALAIPMTLANGSPFPYRDLLIFLTFSVIFVTLVGGGGTLPLIIRWLKLEPDSAEADEERLAVVAMSEAALERLRVLEEEGKIAPAHARTLRYENEYRIRRYRDQGGIAGAETARWADAEDALTRAERDTLIRLREEGKIDNVVLRRLQGELDINTLQASDVRKGPGERPIA